MVTASPMKANHNASMQRVVDEAEYVLRVLRRVRGEASSNAELFDPDAGKRIDEAIARVEDVLRQAQLAVCAKRNPKAA